MAYAVGDAGALLKTTDAGLTWSVEPSPTHLSINSICFPTIIHGYLVGDSGLVMRTSDAGATWEPLVSGTTHAICSRSAFRLAGSSATRSAIPAWSCGLRIAATTGPIAAAPQKTRRAVAFAANDTGWVFGDSGYVQHDQRWPELR